MKDNLNLTELTEEVKQQELEELDEYDALLAEQKDNITVIGVGGGGCNLVNKLVESKIDGSVKMLVANTDIKHLEKVNLDKSKKIVLGPKLTKGRGAGYNPDIGHQAAEESRDRIRRGLEGSDIVIVSTGLGGGTGTGATPVVASISQEIGALTIGVVTKPMVSEGAERNRIATECLKNLRESFHGLIVIPNEKMVALSESDTTVQQALDSVNAVLARAVTGLTNILLKSGEINIDFADIKTIMSFRGLALLGTGHGKGENAVDDAFTSAVESPLLDNITINGARGMITQYEIHPDFPISKIHAISSKISKSCSENVKTKIGYTYNEKLDKDEIHLTLIATGFENDAPAKEVHKPDLIAEIPIPSVQRRVQVKRVANSQGTIDYSQPSYMLRGKD